MSGLLLPRIATRAFGVPLMVDAGKAAAFLVGFGGRIVEGGVSIDGVEPIAHVAFENGRPSDMAGRLGDQLGRRYEQAGVADRMLFTVDNVAVIAIEGTLVHKGAFLGQSSGETSYQGLQAQVARARRDPSVKGVVFEVDSYGGEVAGAFDTADMIAELSAEKPTIAILTDHALSAGFLLAAPARQIVMPETGAAGSLGVITMHADYSQMLEKKGVKVTVLSSGAHKAEGNPYEALPADVADRIRANLHKSRDLFASAVGRYRGARLTRDAAIATEAQSFRGADAVAAGLVDGLARPSEAFSQFVADVNRAGRSYSQGARMSAAKEGLAAVHAAAMSSSAETPMVAKADADAAILKASNDAKAAGMKLGADAERARCKAILGSEAAKGREELAQHFAFDSDMSAEAAVAALGKSAKAEAPKESRLALTPKPQVDASAGAEASTDFERGRQSVISRKPAAKA